MAVQKPLVQVAGQLQQLQGADLANTGPMQVNPQAISADLTLPAGFNALSAGPITINDGVTVTLADNTTWSVL